MLSTNALAGLAIGAKVADVSSTYVAINQSNLAEGNPIADSMIAALGAAPALGILLLIHTALVLTVVSVDKFTRPLLWFMFISTGTVAIWNTITILMT